MYCCGNPPSLHNAQRRQVRLLHYPHIAFSSVQKESAHDLIFGPYCSEKIEWEFLPFLDLYSTDDFDYVAVADHQSH